MSAALCRRCGEEMLPWQYSPELGVCTDCYVIDDRGRFADPQADEKKDDREDS